MTEVLDLTNLHDSHGRPVRFATIPSRHRRRIRKPSLAFVAQQAARAGIEVAKYEIGPDGKIGVVLGQPAEFSHTTKPRDASEWD